MSKRYARQLHSADGLIAAVEQYGFLPFFRNEIHGFSIEELCPPELWFADDVDGPWEWKGPAARSGKCLYGKLFNKKAGFVSREWIPDFANVRRNGYDFDARWDDGLASYKDKEIASHSDIEDEDQTVTMHTSEIGTTATDKLDGDKTVIADAESTVTDKVEYDHVLTGKAYTMAGILMDAKTGLPVLTGEGAKKYTEDDLTKFTSGLMNVLDFQSNTYSIKVKDKDWGNGAAIVKNADGSYTYDASERTENEDGTWTVKTDTQTLTEQEDGTWKLTGLEGSGSGTADGGTSSVRKFEETYKADEVEVTDNGIDWSNNSYQNEKGFQNENMYTTISYRFPGESSIEDLGMSEKSKSKSISTSVNWVAFKQQFFSSAFIAPQNVTNANLAFDTAAPGSELLKVFRFCHFS